MHRLLVDLICLCISCVAVCCEFVAVCCSVLRVCCSVLQCVAVCCEFVAVCCSVLQCVVSLLQCVAVCLCRDCLSSKRRAMHATNCNRLQRIATHCNALQHTATHCNTLQHTRHVKDLLELSLHIPMCLLLRDYVLPETHQISWIRRTLSACTPRTIELFCGKWPIKIRYPVSWLYLNTRAQAHVPQMMIWGGYD